MCPKLKSVFLCKGANQTALLKGELLGHLLCADTWRGAFIEVALLEIRQPQTPDPVFRR
jgi:hypothetical protein